MFRQGLFNKSGTESGMMSNRQLNKYFENVLDQEEDEYSVVDDFSMRSGGMMSPGKFSHETNPIDIMKDGAKVGEMTGGEAILNPEQQKKTASQSPYFRKLMREFAMRGTK